MRVIFLDVDGVLNDAETKARTRNHFPFVDDEKIKRLQKIIDSTGAVIVLSSDWRVGRNIPQVNSDYIELVDKLAEYDIHIYSHTPELEGATRGEEISLWLSRHKDTKDFVILDDRTDLKPYLDHLVITSEFAGGLTEEAMQRAIEVLNCDFTHSYGFAGESWKEY